MSQFADWFAPSLLRTSLTLIVAALLVATCVKWLRLRSPAGEQWAWLLVLVQGVMFASLTVPVPEEWLPHRQPTQPEQVPISVPAEELDHAPHRSAPQAVPLNLQVPERPFDRATKPMEVDVEPAEAVNPELASAPLPIGAPSLRERWPLWPLLACSVWLLGIVAIFVSGAARYAAFVRRLRAGAPAPAEWTDEWSRMCASAGIGASIPLVVAKNLGPALCRLPSGYRLVVPEGTWGKLSPAERNAIFRHELEHYRRNDLWWTFTARVLASVHWFNPFAWLAARRYEAQSEFACDAAAAGDDPAQFSELLVQLASERSRRIAGVQAVAAGSVYDRVQRLLSGGRGHAGWRAAMPVVLALLAICVVCVRVEAVTNAASVVDATRGEGDTGAVEASATTPDESDDVPQLQSLVDRAISTIENRSLSVDVHTPWQLMHQVLGLGLDGRVRLKHDQEATIGLAEWVRGEFKWRDESVWKMTPQGALAHRFTVPFEYEGHPNQFLSYLAAADVPRTFPLVAYDDVGNEFPITVVDLIDGAKRHVTADAMPTYTLWALAHYVPFDDEWTSDNGEQWTITRLVEIQTSQRDQAGPYGDNVRRLALALALQKYRQHNGVRPHAEPYGVWMQVSRELQDRLEMQPSIRRNAVYYVKRRMSNGVDFALSNAHALRGDWEAIHELRWRLIALPAERLHEAWVMEAVRELADWVIENQKSGMEASELYTAAHVLRIYRERESGVALAAVNADEPLANRQAEATTPSLDELMRAVALHEQAYQRFHIKSLDTFVMSEGLTDQERSQYPWSDGRKHQKAMEYGQLKPGTWFKKEGSLIDDVRQSQHDNYVNDAQETSVNHRGTPDGRVGVRLPDPERPPSRHVWPLPLWGVFPLFGGPEQLFLSEEVNKDGTQTRIEPDGEDVKLTIVYGQAPRNHKVVVWLSRAHVWHPIRYQRFMGSETGVPFAEWEALRLEQQNGQWRIVEGVTQWFDWNSMIEPERTTYALTFEIQEATYGDAVSVDLFKYEIPPDAAVHDPTESGLEQAPELTRDFRVTVVDVHGQPMSGATVTSTSRGLNALARNLVSATTDEQGLATVRVPDGEFGLIARKESTRDARWIIGRGFDEMTLVLAPTTAGRAVDEQGTALKDVWIASDPNIYFRTDGLTVDPRSNPSTVQESGWSDAEGTFALTSELTLRRTTDLTLISAIDPEQMRMAFVHVPAAQLGEPLTLILKPVCAVEGTCVLEGVREPTEVRLSLQDTEGRQLASLTTVTSIVEQGLRVAFKLRLPPGEYRLQSRHTSLHSTISIPLTVSEGRRELQLEPQLIPPSGVQALIGKPAPELEGSWRAGEETTLAALRGNVVVLDFWGYWCGPCLSSMPYLMDIADEFRDRPVKWLAIHDPHDTSRDELDGKLAEITRDQWKGRELPFPVLLDASTGDDERSGVTGERYDVREWPTLIVIDRDGNVAGAATHGDLRATIESLLQ